MFWSRLGQDSSHQTATDIMTLSLSGDLALASAIAMAAAMPQSASKNERANESNGRASLRVCVCTCGLSDRAL